jgi:hypothetical protein
MHEDICDILAIRGMQMKMTLRLPIRILIIKKTITNEWRCEKSGPYKWLVGM